MNRVDHCAEGVGGVVPGHDVDLDVDPTLGLADGGGHRRDRRVIVTEQAVARPVIMGMELRRRFSRTILPMPIGSSELVGGRSAVCSRITWLAGLDPLAATTHERAADEEEQDQPEHRRDGD